MGVTLYKPDHRRFPKMYVGSDDEGIPGDVEAIQVELAISKGYTGFRPDGEEMPWMNLADIAFLRKQRGCPVWVLSPTRFLANLANIGLATKFLRLVRRDSAITDWWIDDRTVSPKSPEFAKVAAMLRVSPDEFREHCLAGITMDGR